MVFGISASSLMVPSDIPRGTHGTFGCSYKGSIMISAIYCSIIYNLGTILGTSLRQLYDGIIPNNFSKFGKPSGSGSRSRHPKAVSIL